MSGLDLIIAATIAAVVLSGGLAALIPSIDKLRKSIESFHADYKRVNHVE